jgi:hypothetical protein
MEERCTKDVNDADGISSAKNRAVRKTVVAQRLDVKGWVAGRSVFDT